MDTALRDPLKYEPIQWDEDPSDLQETRRRPRSPEAYRRRRRTGASASSPTAGSSSSSSRCSGNATATRPWSSSSNVHWESRRNFRPAPAGRSGSSSASGCEIVPDTASGNAGSGWPCGRGSPSTSLATWEGESATGPLTSRASQRLDPKPKHDRPHPGAAARGHGAGVG